MAPKLNIDIINRRGMVLLLTIVCIVVIVTGFFYFQNQLNKVREGKNIEFSVISKMKINQLGQWQKECRSDVVAISHSPLLVQAVELEKPVKLTTLCRSKLTTPWRGYF